MQSSIMKTLRPVLGWYPRGFSGRGLTGSGDGMWQMNWLDSSISSVGRASHRWRGLALAMFPYVGAICLVIVTNVADEPLAEKAHQRRPGSQAALYVFVLQLL